jgi:hypothetical protein
VYSSILLNKTFPATVSLEPVYAHYLGTSSASVFGVNKRFAVLENNLMTNQENGFVVYGGVRCACKRERENGKREERRLKG